MQLLVHNFHVRDILLQDVVVLYTSLKFHVLRLMSKSKIILCFRQFLLEALSPLIQSTNVLVSLLQVALRSLFDAMQHIFMISFRDEFELVNSCLFLCEGILRFMSESILLLSMKILKMNLIFCSFNLHDSRLLLNDILSFIR